MFRHSSLPNSRMYPRKAEQLVKKSVQLCHVSLEKLLIPVCLSVNPANESYAMDNILICLMQADTTSVHRENEGRPQHVMHDTTTLRPFPNPTKIICPCEQVGRK